MSRRHATLTVLAACLGDRVGERLWQVRMRRNEARAGNRLLLHLAWHPNTAP